ncbi:dihydrofolate reductase [Azospirillum sp. Sh1]|uniref:dihydrofolate reductase n=1 Tax=Azospirillum sp. Sh1 TaxID=2607285 RepID=UPI0011ECCB11|nr:dihydrofolate reductase [Azospirillum sp. Sh1]KAA0573441.1 dihydrofolate reductase [Azospirillum sp. Sh1]
MIVSIIAAVALNGVIGSKGKLPWHLPSDLKRFRELTIGKPIIMGRKTWESLPDGRLPFRTNIVVSSQAHRAAFIPAPDFVMPSLEAALDLVRRAGEGEACIIGGGEIYKQALPLADRVHLTRVSLHPEGDATFPISPWMPGFKQTLESGWLIENGIQFRYELYLKETA